MLLVLTELHEQGRQGSEFDKERWDFSLKFWPVTTRRDHWQKIFF